MLRKYLIWQLNLITPGNLSGFVAADVEELAEGSGRKQEHGLETGQLCDEIRAVGRSVGRGLF